MVFESKLRFSVGKYYISSSIFLEITECSIVGLVSSFPSVRKNS